MSGDKPVNRIAFVALCVVVTVGIACGLVALTLPQLVGAASTRSDLPPASATPSAVATVLPQGDDKRVADLTELASALEEYHRRFDQYPLSAGSCSNGAFESDADVAFLSDLLRAVVIDAIPRDTDGIGVGLSQAPRASPTFGACDTMYGSKHYLYYSNGAKFALVASVDDPAAIVAGAPGVYLGQGDREWFDGTALMGEWRWSENVYIVSSEQLVPVRR